MLPVKEVVLQEMVLKHSNPYSVSIGLGFDIKLAFAFGIECDGILTVEI